MKMISDKKIDLQFGDGEIYYYPEFLSGEEANKLFAYLRENMPWKQDQVRVFGKWYPQPRLTALTAINENPYSYSGLTLNPFKMPAEIRDLKVRIEEISRAEFTSCLLNLYRDGRDSNGWHADDEKELGKNPVIASLSLGEERMFHLKHRTDKSRKHKMKLENGSLLIMAGSTQHNWLHAIPKTSKPVGERINLTFRYIQ